MKRFSLALIVTSFCFVVNSQTYNRVFPILNTTVKDNPTFVCAYVPISYGNTDVANEMAVYVGSQQCLYTECSFITFNYVTRENATSQDKWGKGASAKQIAFYPGGIKTDQFSPYTPTGRPLCVFECTKSNGLRIINLTDYSTVAVLDEDGDPKNYSYLTVFAGDNATDKDLIVVVGNNKFKIFETIPEGSGVRQISYSGTEPSYFGINGQKYDEPQQGLNIVVDGQETRKIIMK